MPVGCHHIYTGRVLIQAQSHMRCTSVQVHALLTQNLRHHLQCRILQAARNPDECQWLHGARLNIAESALSARDPDAPAVVWAEEGHPESVHSLTLGQLRRRCVRVAIALKSAGIQPGGSLKAGLKCGGCARVAAARNAAGGWPGACLHVAAVASGLVGQGRALQGD